MKPLPIEDLEHVLERTRALWAPARGRRIFLSGGTGLFGIWLLETLSYCNQTLGLNLAATVLTRNPEAFSARMTHLFPSPAVRLLRGDIRDFAPPDEDFDYIIHGAAPTTMHELLSSMELMDTLSGGTRHMIELFRSRRVKSFLFISSGAVYGKQPEQMSHIGETYLGGPDWLDPGSVYSEGKRISELMCSLLARETATRVGIARCFTFVGPHLPLDKHFAIGNFIADALAGRNIVLKGNGTPTRSYLYMADLAVWLWTMLLAERDQKANPLVLNVGSGEAVSIAALAQLTMEVLNPGLRVEYAPNSGTAEPRPHYVPDVRKAETSLGLYPLIGLKEAIRRTADWYR